LELTGWDVGAEVGEFERQAFTDGGVYDNLGLRMFRCLEQSWVKHDTPLRKGDFLALDDAMAALRTASELPDGTPLRRLKELVDTHVTKVDEDQAAASGHSEYQSRMIRGLWEVIRSEPLYRDPILEKLDLDDESAQSLLKYVVASQREPGIGDRLWLNRMMVESALRQVIGRPCLRRSHSAFDCVLVSDAGGKFKVSRDARGGGLISTALRSSDILMDRVWQLESEFFGNTPGVVFIPITDVVRPGTDPHAIDPEIQRQAARMRTDLDRFTDIETSALVQHGYGVARKIIRRNGALVGGEVPSGKPWDPIVRKPEGSDTHVDGEQPSETRVASLLTARQLRRSSKRKVVATLLSLRDWPSYIWIVLLIGLLVGIPYLVRVRSERLRQQEAILSAIAQLNPNHEKILELIRHEPMSEFAPMEFEVVESLDAADLRGFDVISESRVYDLRGWSEKDSVFGAIGYSRTEVRRIPDVVQTPELRIQKDLPIERLNFDCRSERLQPRLFRADLGEGMYRWELRLDFSRVPLQRDADIVARSILPSEIASAFHGGGEFNFIVRLETGILEVWLLMPEGRNYGAFEVSSHPIGKPELSEVVVPAAVVRVALDSVATFRLINPEPGRRYDCRWTWDEPTQTP
jgi:hypothetical protein